MLRAKSWNNEKSNYFWRTKRTKYSYRSRIISRGWTKFFTAYAHRQRLKLCGSAHSDDADQPFQRIPISHSDRSRSVWCGVSAPLDAFLISVFSPGVKQG